MSTNINAKPKPEPDDANTLAGALALEPGLPGPTDLPDVVDLPADADEPDWAHLAARLTGSTEVRATAGLMVAAGANPDDVTRVVERTDGYATALTELLRAVHATILDADGAAFDALVIAQARVMAVAA